MIIRSLFVVFVCLFFLLLSGWGQVDVVYVKIIWKYWKYYKREFLEDQCVFFDWKGVKILCFYLLDIVFKVIVVFEWVIDVEFFEMLIYSGVI